MLFLVISSYNTMIPQYSETLATKEVLSLDWIPLLLAQCLHSNAQRLQGLEAFRYDCEAMSILEDSVHARPHFFKATVALCLLSYAMGVPSLGAKCYSGRGGVA